MEYHVADKTRCNVGTIHLSTYMKVYKVGDIVDVKVRVLFALQLL